MTGSTNRAEQGSALIEVAGLGLLIALLMVPILLAAGRLQAAGEAADEAAQSAALTVARGAAVEAALALSGMLLPDGDITVSVEGGVVTAVARVEVHLVGLPGALTRTVQGRATARLSPYVSVRE